MLGARLGWGWDSSVPAVSLQCPSCRTAQAGAAAPSCCWHQPGPGTDQAAQGTFHWEQPQSRLLSAGGSGEHSQGSVQFLYNLILVPELPCTAEQHLPQRFPSVTKLCHLSVTELIKGIPIL